MGDLAICVQAIEQCLEDPLYGNAVLGKAKRKIFMLITSVFSRYCLLLIPLNEYLRAMGKERGTGCVLCGVPACSASRHAPQQEVSASTSFFR